MNAFPSYNSSSWSQGMSLRDFFAAMAMQGLLSLASNPQAVEAFITNAAGEGLSLNAFLARDAYAKADAMLAERAKGGGA